MPTDTPAVEAIYRELVEQLRAEVTFLQEELRRKDALLEAFAPRSACPTHPLTDTTLTGRDTPDRTRQRSWWRRVLRAIASA